MNEQELDVFTHSYYQSPHPARVPEALAYVTKRDPDPRTNCAWYFFARIIQDHPSLLRETEALFQESTVGRMFLLAVLSQAGDDQSRQFLRECADEPSFSKYRELLEGLTQHWSPGQICPLQRPAQAPNDLDLLWCEFLVSGAPQAVVMIIDVLEFPDTIRAKLQTYLRAGEKLNIISRWQKRRSIEELAKAGVWIDVADRVIVSPQDLDCEMLMENGKMSRERLTRSRGILPFAIADADLQPMAIKASAKWSLRTNAQRHTPVLKICESESRKRVGPCRLALLEIAAHVRLSTNDLSSAFNRLHESLTLNAEKRQRRHDSEEAAIQQLAELSPTVLLNQPAPAASKDITEMARKCADVMAGCSSYCAKLVGRFDGGNERASTVNGREYTFELEFTKPNKYRVSQRIGSDADEWVSLYGKTFRAPAWSDNAISGNESLFNDQLLVDRYLAMIRNVQPVSAQLVDSGQNSYLALSYGDAASGYLQKFGTLEPVMVDKAVVWIDRTNNYLVKAEFDCIPHVLGEIPPTLHVIHYFYCHDVPIDIIPPPFQLLSGTQSAGR